MNRSSVLFTQVLVESAQEKAREAHQKLAVCLAHLERAKELHRQQIARSLESQIPEEKQMASSIAEWWEVSLPEQQ